MIKIDIEKTGFPVKIGTVTFHFDSSLENLVRFVDIEKITNEKLKEAREKAKHIHFPDGVTELNVGDIDPKTMDAAFDLSKEELAIQYDVVFGEGSFKRIYKKYPDMLSLAKAFEQAAYYIAERLETLPKTELGETMKKEYLNKKAAKKKIVK